MEPVVSVLLSTYNSRQFVEKKLAEIQRQTLFPRAEFLFIETASPTRERELLEPFCRAHGNCRLVTLEERKTLYEAWNIGWAESRAPLLCNSNMDDCMHPRLLEEVVAAMARKPWGACSVLIAKQPVDEHCDDWSPARVRRLELSSRPGPFTAWRTNLRERLGDFDGRFYVAGDKDFWARLGSKRVPLGIIPKVLYFYTRSPDQISKSPAGAERREHDRKLAATKPYPFAWPPGVRQRIAWLAFCRRLFPRKFLVP